MDNEHTKDYIAPSQATRNHEFHTAVRELRPRYAAKLAHAPYPHDATEQQKERWRKRRRLYPLPKEGEA